MVFGQAKIASKTVKTKNGDKKINKR